ncbi:MAG TPA: transglutaminase family protein, partial [Candidatus Methylacidiphilales bacterium]|nr:transglutaminase family protein [Candidatus Methylacidiphilales bacterium]
MHLIPKNHPFNNTSSPTTISMPNYDMTARVGCSLVYEASAPTPALMVLRPRQDENFRVTSEHVSCTPQPIPWEEFADAYGNNTIRFVLSPGRNEIRHDALVEFSSVPDLQGDHEPTVSVESYPADVLRYTLPSRYCDSDKLLNFAWQHFGTITHSPARVRAIADWVHQNIEYRYGSGSPELSASDVIFRRFGVCRDFAHAVIALCRCFNIPARYVTGHLPDIGVYDPGSAMDFHAYAEVYLGSTWYTVDARFNVPRIGRLKVAHGLDAVDGAFSTLYGAAILSSFQVWAFQIAPGTVKVGDPVDHSKRIDGTPT